eukprot:GHVP01040554.1.p1 GENE.GHVP01040554.1~~GHVP01040554.1.p1  ORF type:complete len:340 (+),score=68.25 GHVP01040554.1:1706-2725(+)
MYIVVDIGARWTKIGEEEDDYPPVVIESCKTLDESFKKAMLKYKERMLSDSYNLENPGNYQLVLSVDTTNNMETRLALLKACFEFPGTASVFISKKQSLTAFAHEKTSALVIDIGASETRIVPVYNGQAILSAVTLSNKGGDWLTRCTGNLLVSVLKELPETEDRTNLINELSSLPASTDFSNKTFLFLEDFKERMISEIRGNETQEGENIVVRMDDGTMITLEKYKVLELIEGVFAEIHHLASNTFHRLPDSLVAPLLESVLIVGGGSIIPGISIKVAGIMEKVAGHARVVDSEIIQKKFSSFSGGAILAGVEELNYLVISREEYTGNPLRSLEIRDF